MKKHPGMSQFNADVHAITRCIDARQEEIKAAYQRIARLEADLLEVREYQSVLMGATIRYGHSKKDTLWTEGAEEFSAGESYDRAAQVIYQRVEDYWTRSVGKSEAA
jgi:hypothetical protein